MHKTRTQQLAIEFFYTICIYWLHLLTCIEGLSVPQAVCIHKDPERKTMRHGKVFKKIPTPIEKTMQQTTAPKKQENANEKTN